MPPAQGSFADIQALLPAGPTGPTGTQELSCDPCTCPDNYIYDEVMWRKMVLVLLCRIADGLAPGE